MKLFICFIFFLSFQLEIIAQRQFYPFYTRATYYHNMFEGRTTTSGHVFYQEGYTAAHKYIPLGTLVKVVNPENNRWVLVKINDRCPKNGILDLSFAAAKRLGFIYEGIIPVEVTFLSSQSFALWEFQHALFEACFDCTFDDWKRISHLIVGSTDLSKKEYSKGLEKAKKKKKRKWSK